MTFWISPRSNRANSNWKTIRSNCTPASKKLLDLLAPKAAEKKLDLAYMVDDAIPKILVSDVTRLRQILVNLIGNAGKVHASGEVVIEVKPARAQRPRSSAPDHEHDTDFCRHPGGMVAALFGA